MADEVVFGSKEWLDAYVSLYNSKPEMQQALKDLTATVAYEFSDRPDIIPKYIKIEGGVVKEYGEVGDKQMEYVIKANYDIWKSMTLGETDPMNQLMAGKVKIQGNMAALLKHAEGFKQTFECVEQIPTSFD